MDEWLKGLSKPAAIMAGTDCQARETAWACRRLDMECPRQVAILGAGDDDQECCISAPHISSIILPAWTAGYEGARALDRILRGGRPRAGNVLLKPLGIVTRESSDSLGMEDAGIAKAIMFIRQYAGEPISVDDLLRAAALSRSTIERRFRQYLGHSPSSEIVRAHIELSKRLLIETDEKTSAVGRRSGFSQFRAFYRTFRRVTGLRPAEFRQRFRSVSPPPPRRER
jgi:LacI family transcriptional regulator